VRVLAAPDKFRGTASAAQIADAIAQAAKSLGVGCDRAPLADGGEGLLECFGGANQKLDVTDPAGDPVSAAWRLADGVAVIEMALASGLALTGPAHDPIAATTKGTGELIRAALKRGARQVIVGAGGSASTDGGLGAVDVLREFAPLDGSRGYTVRVAADVNTRFFDSAQIFAPQKGASPAQVELLTARLHDVAERYLAEFGVDVRELSGAGAAGGLAGGLAALGAQIVPGFDLVAEQLGLAERIARVDLVIGGEGRLDGTSGSGKSVGALAALCAAAGRPLVIIAGEIADDADPSLAARSLVAQFGRPRALTETTSCVRELAIDLIRTAAARPAI
jgi:glycerate kinase